MTGQDERIAVGVLQPKIYDNLCKKSQAAADKLPKHTEPRITSTGNACFQMN